MEKYRRTGTYCSIGSTLNAFIYIPIQWVEGSYSKKKNLCTVLFFDFGVKIWTQRDIDVNVQTRRMQESNAVQQHRCVVHDGRKSSTFNASPWGPTSVVLQRKESFMMWDLGPMTIGGNSVLEVKTGSLLSTNRFATQFIIYTSLLTALIFPIPQCTSSAAAKTPGWESAWSLRLHLRKQKYCKTKQAWEDKPLHVYIWALTLNPDLPDWAIPSFITAAYHQLIVSKLRHGEVHEVPASDVDFPIDVTGLSEHDLWNKHKPGGTKQCCYFHIQI